MTTTTNVQQVKVNMVTQAQYDTMEKNVNEFYVITDKNYLDEITSSDITTALGYTPYDSSNPDGYITASALSGYEQTTNKVTSITSSSTDTQYPSAKAVYTATNANATAISTINGKIPSQATSTNQLADKAFVNSSISTNTANFIGTFQSVAELEAYSGTKTNNDYAFVETTDTAGNTFYDRYKYVASTSTWTFEYELNNSSFTSAQWAAINSGCTTSTASLAASALQSGDNISLLNNNAGYQANVIETIKVNGTAQTVTSKAVDISVPTTTSAVTSGSTAALTSGGAYSNLVMLSGTQTITGNKTFSGTVALGSSASATTPASSDNSTKLATTAFVKAQGYKTTVTSTDVINALDYTPYNSTNPDGYVTKSIQTVQDIHDNGSSGSLTLSDTTSMYKVTPSAATTISFNGTTSSDTKAYTFELMLNMSSSQAVEFPNSVSWQDGDIPDLSTTGVYFLAFRKIGTQWYGNLQGKW